MMPGRNYDFRTSWKWKKKRRQVLARSRACHWCGAPATTVDHVVPVNRGGAWYDDANLVAACQPCNRERSDNGGVRVIPIRSVFQSRGHYIPSKLSRSTHRGRWAPLRGDYSRRAPEAADGSG